jgi:hypothetical protein
LYLCALWIFGRNEIPADAIENGQDVGDGKSRILACYDLVKICLANNPVINQKEITA